MLELTTGLYGASTAACNWHKALPVFRLSTRPLPALSQRSTSSKCRGPDRQKFCFSLPSCRNVQSCKAQSREADGVSSIDKAKLPSEPTLMYDEPEAAVLLVACAIGLATGAGVVVFNDIIKIIHEAIWTATLPEATSWDYWARDLPFHARWAPLLLPPTLGGLAVGLLRKVSGGFESPKPQKDIDQQAQINKPSKLSAEVAAEKQAARRHAMLKDADTSAQANGTSNTSNKLEQQKLQSAGSASSAGSSRSSERVAQQERIRSGGSASTSSSSSSISDSNSSNTVWSLAWVAESSQQCRQSAAAIAKPFLKATAAAITLGTGNSLGPEGPSVEIGSSAARGLGNVLKSKQRRLLSLVAAGSGAGVAAGFNAPISGVFFAVETVLQSETNELRRANADTTPGLTIAMVLLASVLSAIVSQAGLGQAPAVRVPDYQLQSLLELPLILGFGACCGLVSASFAYSNKVAARVFKQAGQQGLPPVLMPATAGLITGLVALWYPEVLYQGFGNVNAILQNRDHFAPLLLFQILTVKILCTSVSKGSGLVGGAYAPSIFMGATLGSAFGGTASFMFTPLGLSVAAPQAYALVGAAAMLAANCQVPLTSVLLLFELTHDYFIVLPTLGAVGISYWIASLPAATSPFAPSQFRGTSPAADEDTDDSGYMDAFSLSDQLGLDVAREVDVGEEDRQGTVDKQIVSVSTNGSRKGAAINPSFKASRGNGQTEKVLQSMDSSPKAMDDASVACALEEACVLLTVDTSMTEALAVMDEAGQKIALVTNSEGAVVGVLTQESIMRQLSKGPNAPLETLQN